MDPNAALDEIRQLVEPHKRDDRLAELIAALDEWLCKGGALPVEWSLMQEKE